MIKPMNTPIDFDPQAVAAALTELSPQHRVAFCAAVAERLLPNYLAFAAEEEWGDPESLRTALDAVWGCATGSRLSEGERIRLAGACEAAAPEPGDFRSDLASAALDAATAIGAALACCGNGNPEHCAEAATYARDTVDMYIQIRGDVDSDDSDLDAKIRTHPLMVRETDRQASDLRLLRKASIVDTSLTRRLRSGAGVLGNTE